MSRPTLNYLELPAPELAATKRFYSDVFGWVWTDYGPSYASTVLDGFEVALTSEATVAAAPTPQSESSVGPLALFQGDDLVAQIEALTTAGGTVVTAPFDYPGGSRFHFRDPSGNVLGVYRPSTD